MAVLLSVFAIMMKISYGIFAETVWLIVGGIVGFFGLFLGVNAEIFGPTNTGAGGAMSFMAPFTAVMCALVSALTALVMQLMDQNDIGHRVVVCGGVNAVMFLFLFLSSALVTRDWKRAVSW
eukprot:TRINITY_DN9270_c0_g1_i1.p1 TRINITY_DN9270_c0_g1~~TRINITY_DN9270_c0_g1_i1.p1  ORF type:complete len:122 (-),score=12.67 TRINITY_DN9270_c0_g1_i1:102-467(-)